MADTDTLLTPQQFAQKVRTKYPGAYDSIPDEDLTNKFVAKYPVYHDKIQWGNPASTPQASDSIGNRLSEAFSGLAEGAKRVIRHPLDTLSDPFGVQSAQDQFRKQMEQSTTPNIQAGAKAEQLAKTPILPVASTKTFQGMFDPNSQNPASRAITGAAKVAEGLSSPENIGAMAGMALAPEFMAKPIAAGFGVQMAGGAAQAGGQAIQSASQGNWGQAAESGTQAVISAGMAAAPVLIHARAAEETSTTPAAEHLKTQPEETPIQAPPTVSDQFAALRKQAEVRKQEALRGVVKPGVAKEAPSVLRHPDNGNLMEPLETGGFVEHLPDNEGFVYHNEMPEKTTEVTPVEQTKVESPVPVEQQNPPPRPQSPPTESEAKPEVTPEAPTAEPEVEPIKSSPVGTGPIEDLETQMRPLIGRVMRLNQLVTGNRAASVIQRAKDATFGGGEGIQPEDVSKLSKLLGEDVGSSLTQPQLEKLNLMLGREQGTEPVLQSVKRSFGQSAYMKQELLESRQRMLKDSVDPSIDPAKRASLMEALEPRDDGSEQLWMYKPRAGFAKPIDLDPTHPEYPFAPKGFVGKIPVLSLENLEATLGKKPRDLTLGRATEQQQQELKNLQSVLKSSTVSDDQIGELIGTGGFSIEKPDTTKVSQELRDLKNSIYEGSAKKLAGEYHDMLKDLTTQWSQLVGDQPSVLKDQVARLSSGQRKSLPKELYETKEKPIGPARSETTSRTELQEPTKSTSATETPTAAITPAGKKLLGKISKIVDNIETNHPGHRENISTIFEAAIKKHVEEDAQLKFIHRALSVFEQGLKDNAPDSLKKALDQVYQRGEQGTLGQNIAPYSDAEVQKISAFTLDNILKRYEGMSSLELTNYKEGFWAEENRQLLDQSNDPLLRARYKKLADSMPGSNSPSISLSTLFANKAATSEAKAIMREASGERYRTHMILQENMNLFDKLMNGLSIPESLRFMDNMENGQPQVAGVLESSVQKNGRLIKEWQKTYGSQLPSLDDVAGVLRSALDRARTDVHTVTGKLDTYITNYLPHIFNNVGKARDFANDWVTRNPLEGSKSFLRQREYQFLEDAMKAGLQPATYNPVRLSMMRIEQLDRFTMAHKILNQFKDRNNGLGVIHAYPGQQPKGYIALDDSVFQPKQFDPKAGGVISRGQYYAPERIAKAFNNFVSVGLQGKWKIPYTSFSLFDALRGYGNLANQFQLSMSLFHATETLLNSAISDGSIGLKQLINQGKFGQAAIRLGRTASVVAPIIRHTYYGDHLMAEVKNSGTFLDMTSAARDFELANGRISADPFLTSHVINNLKLNWKLTTDELRGTKDRTVAALKIPLNLAGSAVEGMAYPLMNVLIPRVKMGVFYDMAKQIHDEHAGAGPDVIRRELQNAWQSVDNRFGQVVYENLFMNRVIKDAMSLGIRSPAWNIGTGLEVGGGSLDLARSVGKTLTGKQKFTITSRTAYTLTMLGMTAYVNAMYQNLHKDAPKVEGMDYLFPRDGTKSSSGDWNRVYPKLYTYDFINLIHSPVDTLLHKQSPLVGTISDLYRNANYYGRQITDPADPFAIRAGKMAAYTLTNNMPFSISNMKERQLRGETGIQAAIESSAGILPAPKWAGQTNAEQLASKYFQGTQPKGPEDAVSFERKADFIRLRERLEKGQVTDDQMQEAYNKGTIRPKQLKYLYDSRNQSMLERYTPRLSFSQAWNVWKAANDTEKEKLLPIIIKKAVQEAPDNQQEYMDQIQNYLDSRK